MNSYIIRPLAQIKKKLSSKETLSPDTIDSIIGELEMIKLNIEQHITNMPENREQNNILSAAHNAVQNLRQHRIIGDEDHRESAVGQKSGSIPEYPL